jgi:hypothetical protein
MEFLRVSSSPFIIHNMYKWPSPEKKLFLSEPLLLADDNQ